MALPNIFSLNVTTLSSNYSSDFSATSASYLYDYGPNFSNAVFYKQLSGNAPFLNVNFQLITPTSFENITSVDIDFKDVASESFSAVDYETFSSTIFSHAYSLPGTYHIDAILYSSDQPPANLNIAQVNLTEIAVQPIISIFYENGIPYESEDENSSPLTLQFCTTGTIAGSFPLENFIWDFDNEVITTSRHITTTITNLSAFPLDLTDPRNFITVYPFSRKTLEDSTILVVLSAISMTSGTASTTAFNINNLQLPDPKIRKLIKTRMYGTDNTLLLFFEDEDLMTHCHLLSAYV